MTEQQTKQKKVLATSLLVGAGLLVLGAIAFSTDILTPQTAESKVVASVNDETITEDQLNARSWQIEQIYGQTPETELVLDQMIGEILLYQEAREQDVTVSEEDVETQYQESVEGLGGEDALLERLEYMQTTPDIFREDIKRQLTIEQYLEDAMGEEDLSVTDEEIETTYNEVAAETTELPPLEDVEEQIRTELEQQKQNNFVLELIEELRENADVQIYV